MNRFDKFLPQDEESRKRRKEHLVKPIGAIAAAIFFIGGAVGLGKMTGPEFSKETITETVVPGDTLWNKAGEVKGSDKFDRNVIITHISNMEENKETFANGTLDQGEDITHPVSVK